MPKNIKKVKRRWWKNLPPGELYQFNDGDIICADALTFLSNLRAQCADIVFLDPPFNLGKRYGSNKIRTDRLREIDYYDFLIRILLQSLRILKDGGALYLYHIPRWAMRFSGFLQEFLEFRHWIAISMKNGMPLPKKLYPAHYTLLYFTKGKPETFKRPKIPIQTCRHCKRPIRDYGGYKKYLTNGINLSDVWDDLSPVRHRKHKNRLANELPPAIPNRIVEISGQRNGLLVDPFAGSGSSLIAARGVKMKFVACDREIEACNVMIRRLTTHQDKKA